MIIFYYLKLIFKIEIIKMFKLFFMKFNNLFIKFNSLIHKLNYYNLINYYIKE